MLLNALQNNVWRHSFLEERFGNLEASLSPSLRLEENRLSSYVPLLYHLQHMSTIMFPSSLSLIQDHSLFVPLSNLPVLNLVESVCRWAQACTPFPTHMVDNKILDFPCFTSIKWFTQNDQLEAALAKPTSGLIAPKFVPRRGFALLGFSLYLLRALISPCGVIIVTPIFSSSLLKLLSAFLVFAAGLCWIWLRCLTSHFMLLIYVFWISFQELYNTFYQDGDISEKRHSYWVFTTAYINNGVFESWKINYMGGIQTTAYLMNFICCI